MTESTVQSVTVEPLESIAPGRWFRITHRTTYIYSDNVSASYGRCYLRPRELPWQHCKDHQLTIDPAPSDAAETIDVYGNVDRYFHVTTGHRELVVTGVSLVWVSEPQIDLLAAGKAWEAAALGPKSDPDSAEFVLESPLIEVTDEVRTYARVSFPPGRPLIDAIVDLTHRIHVDFAYTAGATSVGTSIPEVMATRAGVCQDFAHLAVACLRALGVPARYVSGYLATDPPPGKERMVGVDATHAWAAVRVSDGNWLALDPTNDQLVDERYTTVAWGRDYGDVTPLRGVIFTDATESAMRVTVDVEPLAELPSH